MEADGKGYRTITGSGSESPPPPKGRSALARPATASDVGDRMWAIRWRKREAALRSLIAQWRQPPIVRRVFPDSRLDPMR